MLITGLQVRLQIISYRPALLFKERKVRKEKGYKKDKYFKTEDDVSRILCKYIKVTQCKMSKNKYSIKLDKQYLLTFYDEAVLFVVN